MDKKRALIILIKESYLMPVKIKINLLKKVKNMSEEEVNQIGQLLSYEQDFVEDNQEKIIKTAEELIK